MQKKATTSFICTVLDEEKSITDLLESLKIQTVKANEIIFVDGGSHDKTPELLKDSSLKHKFFKEKGNRAIGRNFGIEKADGDIILVTDAGCMLDKNWVKNITEPFGKETVDVAAGFYTPITKNIFQKCLATYTSVMADRVDPKNFLPSSRSVAFRKSAWKKVNGYPQYLDTCEDLVFAKKLKEHGCKFVFVKEAIVHWPQRKNILEAFVQFFQYAKGDGKARYFRAQTPFLFFRDIGAIVIFCAAFITKSKELAGITLILFFLYVLWSISKNYRYIKNPQAFIYLPFLQIASDIAVGIGMTIGLLQSLFISHRTNKNPTE
ncbi:MAG TPA: glycosyltransferase [Candidatus Saccharimonadales bacterium]|nr:glycosyltransferase [Candidatus Saccharimonadales bacterium]